MYSDTLDNKKIENIFKDDNNPETLNLTFSHGNSVLRTYKKTRLMRRESRIINYIPK